MDDISLSRVLKRINRAVSIIDSHSQSFNQSVAQPKVQTTEVVAPEPAPQETPELIPIPVRKRYKRTTYDISVKNLATTAEDILKVEGIGFLKEMVVVADHKINLILIIDGREILVDRSTWDDLAAITTFSNTITARVVGSSFVLILNEVYFKRSFDMRVWFGTAANISTILGFYDLCEVWQ